MSTLPPVPETAPVASSAALAAFSPKARVCPECGDEFFAPAKGPGGHKRFCRDSCRNAWGNREAAEGKVLVTIAKAWRKTRGGGELGKRAFEEMTRILDILNDRSVQAGRPGITQKGEGPLRPYLDAVLRDTFTDRDRPHVRRKRKAA